nr:glycosyltransferase [candidate division Zixibacteria bacterium]
MNILIIDEEFPYPLNSGKNIRNFNLARHLAKSNRVYYLAYGRDESDGFRFMASAGMTPIAVDEIDRKQTGPAFYLKLLMNIFSPRPYIVTSHYSARFESKLVDLLKETGFDILAAQWTPYALFMKNIKNVKKILLTQNIESAIWQRYYENESNPLRRWYINLQRKKIDNFERQCLTWVNGATAVSESEATTLKELNKNCPVEIIENGVDIEYFSPKQTEVDPNLLTFTGSMDWRPNQDAVLYFVQEIFPLLKNINPRVKTLIVGRTPPEKIKTLSRIDGIEVTGTVDDVRPYIARAALYIVPLRIGGGSRLKILEAMAMKKPVVSTTIGAEGLYVGDGENIILADNPHYFAEACAGALRDREASAALAENGFNLVHQRYSWNTIGDRLQDFFNMVLTGKTV